MKIRSISLAAALACVASSSFALTPGQIDSSTVQLWINGATAPTAAVYGAISKLCVDDLGNSDLHVYLEKTPAVATDAVPGKSAAGKFAAYACTMGPLAGSLAGMKTVVYHTFDVGSFEAYTPHLVQAGEPASTLINQTVKRLNDITTAACVASGAVANTFTGCGAAGVLTTPNTSVNALPTMPVGGISDTEYPLNQLNLGVGKSLADIGSEVSTNVAQGFGVAMSYPLFIAMQTAQGLSGSCPVVAGVPTITPACQPNITRVQYSSLVSSAVADKDAKVLGIAAGGPLTVERRVGTSGTQSASNAFFLNKPCATGLPQGELALEGSNTATSSTFPGGVTIRSNSGSGDVKTNLSAATTAGTYALGILSLENTQGTATEKFAFAKLNGVSPTTDTKQRQTAIDGQYEMWYEMVAFTAATAPQEGVDLISSMVTALADPAITDLKGLFVTPLSGFTNAGAPTQVSKSYKGGNACSAAQQ